MAITKAAVLRHDVRRSARTPANVALRHHQIEILVALQRHAKRRDASSRCAGFHAPHLWQSHERRNCEQREGCPRGGPAQAHHRAKDHLVAFPSRIFQIPDK